MTHLGFIARFFLANLPVWGTDRMKKLALQRLIRKLKGDRVPIYDPIRDRLLRPFAEALVALKEAVDSLEPVYRATVVGNEADRRKSELDLARSLLRRSGLETTSLAFETIKDEVFAKGARTIGDIDALFAARILVFDDSAFKDCSLGIDNNRRIAALCDFDFDALLGNFRRQGQDSGTLGNAPAFPVGENLHDLYFLLEGLRIDSGTEDSLRLLAQSVSVAGHGVDECLASLSRIKDLLADRLESKRLGMVIRCIESDAELELRMDRIEGTCLAALVKGFRSDFAKRRKEYLEVQSRLDFEQKMKDLFGDIPLVPLEGYTEERGTVLAEGGLPGFKYIQPLRILKSFYSLHFRKTVAPAVSAIALEVDIVDRDFNKQIGDDVESVMAMAIALVKFEEDLTVGPFSRIGPIVETLPRMPLDGPVLTKARRLVDDINESADRVIQGSFLRLGVLRDTLARLAGDIRRPSPTLVLNAPYLLSTKPELVRGLLKAGQIVDKALAVLKLFAVDLSAAKKDLGKLEQTAV